MVQSKRWGKLRREVLAAHPLCQLCEERGFVTIATEVHHKTPVEDGLGEDEMRRLCFDYHNLMALCHQCHVEVHKGMGRGGAERTRRATERQLEQFKEKFKEAFENG